MQKEETMIGLIVRRFFWTLPVLLVISVVTFGLMKAAPGGPWDRDAESKQIDPRIQKLLDQIVRVLLGQNGIRRDRRVAVVRMTGGTHLRGDLLAFGRIRLRGRLLLRQRRSTQGGQCRQYRHGTTPHRHSHRLPLIVVPDVVR